MSKLPIYVSIVSHGDLEEIYKNELSNLKEQYNVIIRENIGTIIEHSSGPQLIKNLNKRGFGANHNANFETIMEDDFWFVICNPDIQIEPAVIQKLADTASEKNADLIAPLLINSKTHEFDHNARKTPSLRGFICSKFGIKDPTRYTSDELGTLTSPDWLSGAFIMINSRCYRKLNGFDERFFMYLEDADLCRRAKEKGYKLIFDKRHQAKHMARRGSKSIFSFLFWCHIKSILQYWKKYAF